MRRSTFGGFAEKHAGGTLHLHAWAQRWIEVHDDGLVTWHKSQGAERRGELHMLPDPASIVERDGEISVQGAEGRALRLRFRGYDAAAEQARWYRALFGASGAERVLQRAAALRTIVSSAAAAADGTTVHVVESAHSAMAHCDSEVRVAVDPAGGGGALVRLDPRTHPGVTATICAADDDDTLLCDDPVTGYDPVYVPASEFRVRFRTAPRGFFRLEAVASPPVGYHALMALPGAVVLESEHPYANLALTHQRISMEAGCGVRLHFHPKCRTEARVDRLTVRSVDAAPNDPYDGVLAGPFSGDDWGPPEGVFLPETDVIVSFCSDATDNDWGWRLVVVPSLPTLGFHAAAMLPGAVRLESAHPWPRQPIQNQRLAVAGAGEGDQQGMRIFFDPRCHSEPNIGRLEIRGPGGLLAGSFSGSSKNRRRGNWPPSVYVHATEVVVSATNGGDGTDWGWRLAAVPSAPAGFHAQPDDVVVEVGVEGPRHRVSVDPGLGGMRVFFEPRCRVDRQCVSVTLEAADGSVLAGPFAGGRTGYGPAHSALGEEGVFVPATEAFAVFDGDSGSGWRLAAVPCAPTGFFALPLEGAARVESAHPYGDDELTHQRLAVPPGDGDRGMRVFFDPRCYTERHADYVTIRRVDADPDNPDAGLLAGPFSGSVFDWPTEAVELDESEVVVSFRSDGSNSGTWGWALAALPRLEAEAETEAEAESAHPYVSGSRSRSTLSVAGDADGMLLRFDARSRTAGAADCVTVLSPDNELLAGPFWGREPWPERVFLPHTRVIVAFAAAGGGNGSDWGWRVAAEPSAPAGFFAALAQPGAVVLESAHPYVASTETHTPVSVDGSGGGMRLLFDPRSCTERGVDYVTIRDADASRDNVNDGVLKGPFSGPWPDQEIYIHATDAIVSFRSTSGGGGGCWGWRVVAVPSAPVGFFAALGQPGAVVLESAHPYVASTETHTPVHVDPAGGGGMLVFLHPKSGVRDCDGYLVLRSADAAPDKAGDGVLSPALMGRLGEAAPIHLPVCDAVVSFVTEPSASPGGEWGWQMVAVPAAREGKYGGAQWW